MRRLPADGRIGLGLLAVCGVFLNDLLATDATGPFVTPTTLPIALVVLLGLLSLALFGGSLLRPADSAARPDAGGLLRVGGMVVWTAVYVAALPWAGYLAASAGFLIGASLLYGNRRWDVILGLAVLLPLALLLFFEKVMIVLLPASKLAS